MLNEAAERYSAIFSDRDALCVSFDTSRDTRTGGSILRIDGASAPTYDGCSAGEKRRIDIIAALSLRALARWRLASPINVAVWDEVLDPLDAAGIERAMTVLQRDLDELESVFVITHSDLVREAFPDAPVWHVIREHGISRLEIE